MLVILVFTVLLITAEPEIQFQLHFNTDFTFMTFLLNLLNIVRCDELRLRFK